MKSLLTILLLIISLNSFSQIEIGMNNLFFGESTWLYKLSKSEAYSRSFNHPKNELFNEVSSDKISIYYENDGYWKFIGKLSTLEVRKGGENLTSGSQYLYFKKGYRVAYSYMDNEPIEIIFKEKHWKVK